MALKEIRLRRRGPGDGIRRSLLSLAERKSLEGDVRAPNRGKCTGGVADLLMGHGIRIRLRRALIRLRRRRASNEGHRGEAQYGNEALIHEANPPLMSTG
jgi:hypothetical protein